MIMGWVLLDRVVELVACGHVQWMHKNSHDVGGVRFPALQKFFRKETS